MEKEAIDALLVATALRWRHLSTGLSRAPQSCGERVFTHAVTLALLVRWVGAVVVVVEGGGAGAGGGLTLVVPTRVME